MRSRLRWQSLAAALVAIAWLAPPSKGDVEVTHKQQVLIPIVGIPYFSSTKSGSSFAGTIEIESFVSTGSGLAVEGVLNFRNRSASLVFPVEVRRADCRAFELAIGPPDFRGLQDPLLLLETPDGNPMRQADFCDIGRALAAGDFDDMARRLNEEALLEAGFLGGHSCPWTTGLACATAVGLCAGACVLGPECLVCLAGVGSTQCYDCATGQ